MRDRWFWRDLVRPIYGKHERRLVERLRYAVYVEEMGKPYPSADHRGRRLTDALDDVSLILGAYDSDGTLIGTMRGTPGAAPSLDALEGENLGIEAWADVPRSCLMFCSRLIVDPRARGRARAAVSLNCGMYFYCREQKIRVALCSTAARLVGYFERYGFRPYGESFRDMDSGQELTRLALVLEDVEHLKAVSSPFVMEAAARANVPPERSWMNRVHEVMHNSTAANHREYAESMS